MNRSLVSLVAVLASLIGFSARADVVTIDFSGVVEAEQLLRSGQNMPGYSGSTTTFTGSFSFDTLAPYFGPAQTGSVYRWWGAALTFEMGGYNYGFIQYNDTNDQYITVPTVPYTVNATSGNLYVNAETTAVDGQESDLSFGLGINNISPTLTLAGLESLPLSDFITPGGFELVELFNTQQSDYQFQGNITNVTGISVVPSAPGPPSLVLVALPAVLAVAEVICRRFLSRSLC